MLNKIEELIEDEEELLPLHQEIPIEEEEELMPIKEFGETPQPIVEIPTAIPLPNSYLWKIKGTCVVIDRNTHFVIGYHDSKFNVHMRKTDSVEEVCNKYGLVYFHPSYLPRILGQR